MITSRRLLASAAAALAVATLPAAGAMAASTGDASTGAPAHPAALRSRVLHLTRGGRKATFTIHGDWKLARGVRLPVTPLPHGRTASLAGSSSAGSGTGRSAAASTSATSSDWSGYVAVANKGVRLRYVTADFNVPSLNCASSQPGTSGTSYYASWTGLDGWAGDPAIEQQGTEGYCAGSTQGLYVFYEMYPAGPVVFTGASPGDAIQASTYWNPATGRYTLQVKDLTQNGAGVTETVACGGTCADTSAEVVSLAPGNDPAQYGLADFGAENFTSAGVTARNGTKGKLTQNSLWSVDSVNMVNPATGDTLATAGPAEGGAAFVTTWAASQ